MHSTATQNWPCAGTCAAWEASPYPRKGAPEPPSRPTWAKAAHSIRPECKDMSFNTKYPPFPLKKIANLLQKGETWEMPAEEAAAWLLARCL